MNDKINESQAIFQSASQINNMPYNDDKKQLMVQIEAFLCQPKGNGLV